MSAPAFDLDNVGPGPDRLSLSDLDEAVEAAVLLFQRDHHCTNCRKQVREVADRYDEFRRRTVEVISIVPEPPGRVREWRDAYDLPFPLLADPDASAGEAYGQPVRFGILGDLSDFVGRMPVVVIVDLRGDPEIAWSHAGSSTFDRPSIEEILDRIDEVLENG